MSKSQNELNLDIHSYDDDELCNLLNLYQHSRGETQSDVFLI